MRKVFICQSNYLPWKGYFDAINIADVFIIYDDVQYTKHDWRNRNRIKTRQGPRWITIPCGTNINRLICEVQLSDSYWQKYHWKIIRANYARAKYFKKYVDFFEYVYLDKSWKKLSVTPPGSMLAIRTRTSPGMSSISFTSQ